MTSPSRPVAARGRFGIVEGVAAEARQGAPGGEAEQPLRRPAQAGDAVPRLANGAAMAAKGAQRGISAISRSLAPMPCAASPAPPAASIFIFAMSTPVGHSRRQPLQDTQSLSAACTSSEASASGPSWPVSARRSVLARPRVRCCSSRVAR